MKRAKKLEDIKAIEKMSVGSIDRLKGIRASYYYSRKKERLLTLLLAEYMLYGLVEGGVLEEKEKNELMEWVQNV